MSIITLENKNDGKLNNCLINANDKNVDSNKNNNQDLLQNDDLGIISNYNTKTIDSNLLNTNMVSSTNTSNPKVILVGIVSKGSIEKNNVFMLGPDNNCEFKPVCVKAIHCKKIEVKKVFQGQYCTLEVDAKESDVRKGMVLIDTQTKPTASKVIEADIWNISDKDIKLVGDKTQFVISSGHVRQTATVKAIQEEGTELREEIIIKPEETKTLTIEFCYNPEYIQKGSHLLILENSFKCYGVVTKLIK